MDGEVEEEEVRKQREWERERERERGRQTEWWIVRLASDFLDEARRADEASEHCVGVSMCVCICVGRLCMYGCVCERVG